MINLLISQIKQDKCQPLVDYINIILEDLEYWTNNGKVHIIYINYKLRIRITYDYVGVNEKIAYYYVHYYNSHKSPIIVKYHPKVIWQSE